ncbi:MAG: cofactor-independent phosphoglycerate mutase [Clostridiales Family XIII bacterium]|jgi:2,3-bisphosphoglycerate-independent phosphoglycerate mutase|nr:cofactor-independent phosphoglycerate mutase [Clostridiales Family XIII bacterium]
MKYLILVPDGCADRPIPALGGRTPLEAAGLENINALAKVSETGTVKTIPDGIAPGSDAANLSVMGFDPAVYLTGRSPLEAVSMGIKMSDTDVAFRTNLVTLDGDGDYADLIIRDHSSGDISSEEARILMETVEEKLGGGAIRFYPGVSYRHAMIVENGRDDYVLTPPHDVLTQRAGDHLPRGEGADEIEALMRKSHEILKDHPVNTERVRKGLRPANSIWIWGQGKKPRLSSFYEKYGIRGAVISAVDLIKGIGLCAGLDVRDIPGATGTLRTNFTGKAEGAVAEFKNGKDFVYIHVEAPDECGHQGDLEGKIESMRRIDAEVFKPVHDYLKACGEPYRILVVPDHRTPMEMRTHSAEPVPFVLFDSENPLPEDAGKAFSEQAGQKGTYYDSGHALADRFFGGGASCEAQGGKR